MTRWSVAPGFVPSVIDKINVKILLTTRDVPQILLYFYGVEVVIITM